MGIYLSTANREVELDSDEGNGLKCVAGGVQGWRKHMEDAHIACCDVVKAMNMKTKNSEPMSMFAVFDGHGGKEVARYCEDRFVPEFVGLESFKKGDYQSALRECFHLMDVLLEDKSNEFVLRKYRKIPNPSDRKTPIAEKSSTSSKNNEKKALNEDQAIKFFKRLMLQEQAKKTGKPVQAMDDDDFDFEMDTGDDGEDENFDVSQVKDYVPNSGPPSIKVPGADGFQCNLADHRVTAGCTSVVVFRCGNQIICANAGDSRAIMSRANGVCLPLSEDHKPSQETESSRIKAAGGFINQVGRVNGNLNLTRSLGDLKYKQVPRVAKKDQIITAEPDITVATLRPDDEFILVACDGVWDCLTNEAAVDFVRERLKRGMSERQVVEAIFERCISEDPRKTQGIGGDNMTAIVVRLEGAKNW